jgi:hypothetical protein
MMETWEFLQDARRSWYWRRTRATGSHNVSSRVFDSRAACVADAVAHGYDPEAEIAPPPDRNSIG